MRADLQPGGQRYFHEFLEIVGINFPPLFSGESATRSLSTLRALPSCDRSRPDPWYRRVPVAHYPLMQRENARAFRGISVHRRHGRVLPNSCLRRDARFLKSNLPEMDLSALREPSANILPLISWLAKGTRRKRREYTHAERWVNGEKNLITAKFLFLGESEFN